MSVSSGSVLRRMARRRILASVAPAAFAAFLAACAGSGAKGDATTFPAIPPPALAPGRTVACAPLPAGAATAGDVSVSLTELRCGTATLTAGGGVAEVADPSGGTIVQAFVDVAALRAATAPALEVACADGRRLTPSGFRSSLAYRPGQALAAGERERGAVLLAIPGNCVSPQLATGGGGAALFPLLP